MLHRTDSHERHAAVTLSVLGLFACIRAASATSGVVHQERIYGTHRNDNGNASALASWYGAKYAQRMERHGHSHNPVEGMRVARALASNKTINETIEHVTRDEAKNIGIAVYACAGIAITVYIALLCRSFWLLRSNVHRDDKDSNHYRWAVACHMMVFCFVNHIILFLPIAVQVPLEDKLRMSVLEYNILMGMRWGMGLLAAMVAPWLRRRIGWSRFMIYAYGSVTVAGLLIIWAVKSESYSATLACGCLLGFVTCCSNIIVEVVRTNLFSGSEQSTAAGLINTGMPLGVIFIMFMAPVLRHGASLELTFALGVAMGLIGLVSAFICGWIAAVLPADSANSVEHEITSTAVVLGKVWLPLAILTFGYMNIFALRENIAGMLMRSDGLDLLEANSVSVVPVVTLALTSAPVGYVMDQVGQRPFLLIVSSLGLGVSSHFQLGVAAEVRFVAMILYGLMWAMFQNAIWTTVSLAVRDNEADLAFSVVEGCQTSAVAVFSLAVGAALQCCGEYAGCFWLQVVCYAATFAAAVLCVWDHYANSSILAGTTKQGEMKDSSPIASATDLE